MPLPKDAIQLNSTALPEDAIPLDVPSEKPLDVVGRAKQWMTEEPSDPRRSTVFPWEPTWPGEAVRAVGRFIVPGTKGEAVTQGLMGAAGAGAALPAVRALGKFAPPLARILGGAGAGAAGSVVDNGDPTMGAVVGGGLTAAMEGAVPVVGAGLRWGTGAKGRIGERLAKDVRSFTETQVPELTPTIAAAKSGIGPMRGGKTAAALEEVALGNSGQKTLSNVMEQGMLDATLAAKGQGIQSPAFDKALELLQHGAVSDPLLRDQLPRLVPGPNGYLPSQAQELLARVGSMLKGNPLERKVNDRDLTALYSKMLEDTARGLPRQSAEVFSTARDKYRAGESLFDMLRKSSARQGGPNSVALNEPQLQKYISENRAELRTKFGPAFDDLVAVLNRGGQLGTRSIMTPGTGETASALRQVYGRGQGGAPQMVGSVVRTGLPNLGYQSTGRAPYQASSGFQTLMDILGINTFGGQ